MSYSSRPSRTRVLRRVAAVTTSLAVAVVPVAALTSTAATATSTTAPAPAPAHKAKVAHRCKTTTLPPVVQGRSADLKRGLPAGAWIWHNKRGFHLRVTHDSKSKLVFRGTVTSSGKVWSHRIYRNEKRDVLWRNNRHNAVKFVLRNHGGIDGIDFVTGCARTVTISLRVDGQPMSTTQIHLGRNGANPLANPVVITRIPRP